MRSPPTYLYLVAVTAALAFASMVVCASAAYEGQSFLLFLFFVAQRRYE